MYDEAKTSSEKETLSSPFLLAIWTFDAKKLAGNLLGSPYQADPALIAHQILCLFQITSVAEHLSNNNAHTRFSVLSANTLGISVALLQKTNVKLPISP